MNTNQLGKKRAAFYLDYARQHKEFSELPKKTQARVLYEERPDLFETLEKARCFVRSLTGAHGQTKSDLYKYSGLREQVPQSISTIQEGLAKLKAWELKRPEPLQLLDCRIFVMSDIHIPFQDTAALSLALQFCSEYQPDIILLNGDILDQYAASRWGKETDMPPLEYELKEGRKFLKLLRDSFPSARIIYKIGNHEERLHRYVMENADALKGLKQLKLSYLLKFKEYGIEEVGREPIYAGKLNILHGHELGRSVFSPVSPARGGWIRTYSNLMIGHYHQASEHTAGNLRGERFAVYSLGCLCDLSPDYDPYAFTRWGHGFGTVEVEPDGHFTARVYKIVNGVIR